MILPCVCVCVCLRAPRLKQAPKFLKFGLARLDKTTSHFPDVICGWLMPGRWLDKTVLLDKSTSHFLKMLSVDGSCHQTALWDLIKQQLDKTMLSEQFLRLSHDRVHPPFLKLSHDSFASIVVDMWHTPSPMGLDKTVGWPIDVTWPFPPLFHQPVLFPSLKTGMCFDFLKH